MDTRNLLAQRARAERPAAHNPALFLFAALLCAAGVAATYWFFVRTTTGQLADESAFQEAELIAPATERPVIAFLDELPLISVFIAVIVVVFVSILRHRISPAVIALGTFGAANVSSQLLKRTVLDRPDRGVVTLDFNSLPSGHTTLAASAAAAVFLLASPRWRPLVALFGGSYAVLAGAATFLNLWHRPADVVASLLVVAAWTLVGGLVMMRTNPDWNRWPANGAAQGTAKVIAVICAVPGVLATAASLGLYFYARWNPTAVSTSAPLYFWAGLTLIVGVGFLVSALACWLFNQQAGDPARVAGGSRGNRR
ncbi:phosphatase PAP2 family protein [Arthrobacter sp. zg-Y1116]|uniref:phosphatase PAP2 family protein n=1 Tax=Arthrobacter sp. zg-Y1116 TaxID=2964611 RepID=UPI002103E3AC|nr:phosphatase PAP2 family protein [Arthrobacter sp. zg-Y1116]MCQ1945726.1 phosphatase PAP2 family protein [Arthrobacter sp. zg-Y1116]